MTSNTDIAWAQVLKPSPKLLLLALVRRGEASNGMCQVSVPDLAADLNATPMTVFSSIKTLEKAGLLLVVHSRHGRPNRYIVMLGGKG